MRQLKTKVQAETMKKTVAYLRVSSVGQAEDGESLERQAARIRAYCIAKGLPEPEFISDEGVSGSKRKRPGFQRIVTMCKTGELGHLVIYDMSRLNRNVVNSYEFFTLATKSGVEVHDVQKGGIVKTGTANEKVQFGIEAVLSQYYRDVISDKTKEALRHKREKGEKTGGLVPFGYQVVDGVRLVPKPEEMATMQTMAELREAGLSLRAIVDVLNQRNIPTKSGKSKWSPQAVKNVLDRAANAICADERLSPAEKDSRLHEVTGALYQVNCPS
jgi:site-specific DNA recombinase